MAAKKTTTKPAKNAAKNRKVATPRYKSFRLQKSIKTPKPPLPSVAALCRQTLELLRRNKRYFIRFILLYALMTLIFIQAANGFTNLAQSKQDLGDQAGGNLQTSLVLYATLIGSSGQSSDQVVSLYQFVIILIFGLAAIYALRHMFQPGTKEAKITVKQSLYRGMTPLVPMLLVICVIAVELLPLSIGTGLYSIVSTTGLAVTNVERILWVIFVGLLGLLSLYMISSTIFSLFIVTLPEATPMKAIRASRELARFRHLALIRKLVALPIIILVALGLVMLPFILWLPAIASPIFYLLSALVLPVSLTYTYNLYRSML